MTLCPLVFGFVLYKNYENLNVLSVRKKFGTIYATCHLESMDIYPLSYSIIYMLRRSMFVLLTFALYPLPGIQIQVFVYSSVLYIIYLNSNRIFHDWF